LLTLIEHEDYYKHKMSQIKENPRRLRIIMKALKSSGILDKPSVKLVSPESATDKDVRVLHTDQLVDLVKHGSMVGETAITGDTITNEYTFQAALRAVGGGFLAAETAISKNDSVAFLLARPPGHHATKTKAMGFCFFNNIALAANNLIAQNKAKRIAIIDFDNHYGNGAADLFYGRNDILTISMHADPNYSFPFQGRVSEIGERSGTGYNICIPLPLQTGDKEYLSTFDEIIPSIVRDYKPDIIFVAAGYDGLKDDPYGYLGLSVYGFQLITERINALAKELCHGKMVMTLEGGYKFDELGEAFMASISPFLPNYVKSDKKDDSKLSSGGNKGMLKNTLDELKHILKPYWKIGK